MKTFVSVHVVKQSHSMRRKIYRDRGKTKIKHYKPLTFLKSQYRHFFLPHCSKKKKKRQKSSPSLITTPFPTQPHKNQKTQR